MSNGALFHHFKTKEAIVAALYADAIADFQAGHWDIVDGRPASLREGVHAIVAHHLEWVQANPERARFLYEAGRLDGDDEAMLELRRRNGELAAQYAAWYVPLVERGEARPVRPGLLVAIVSGAAHAVCRHWLGGARERPLVRHTGELAHAAWAGLAGPSAFATAGDSGEAVTPVAANALPAPIPARIRVEVIGADGAVLGSTDAPLS